MATDPIFVCEILSTFIVTSFRGERCPSGKCWARQTRKKATKEINVRSNLYLHITKIFCMTDCLPMVFYVIFYSHDIVWYCMELLCILWYCIVFMSFHCIIWYCMVLYYILRYCMVLHCWLRRAGCISQDTYLLYLIIIDSTMFL